MTKTLHMQLSLNHPPNLVFESLTNQSAVESWFAEAASIDLSQNAYDFWGRFTPETPSPAEGKHPITAYSPDQKLAFEWVLRSSATHVTFTLHPQSDQTILVVQHDGAAAEESHFEVYEFEDFWFLSLENLRRYLAGNVEGIIRCDFSATMKGDIHHSVLIDGSPEAVFQTLIRPDQLERWIASQAQIEPHVGGKLDIGWGQAGAIKIITLEANQTFAYEWSGEESTVITWELAESGGKTRLTLVHSGFAADKDTSGIHTGWLNYMSRIKSMVEEGETYYPPILKVNPDMAWIYAASINNRQHELIAI